MSEQYDKSKIGKKIARGGDRTVYWYGDTQVIKFSSIPYLVGKKMSAKMSRDYALCKKYFGDYIVETEIITNEHGRGHVEIQAYIQGTELSKKHLHNKEIMAQLKIIACGVITMEQDGCAPIDLIGHKGLLCMCLSNIFVDEHNKLRIFDATLLEGTSVGFFGIIATPFLLLARMRQQYVLKQFLK